MGPITSNAEARLYGTQSDLRRDEQGCVDKRANVCAIINATKLFVHGLSKGSALNAIAATVIRKLYHNRLETRHRITWI